jgi:acyl carrier protein phosphodiesterase
MNFLAHAFFARHDREVGIGCFVADLLKGAIPESLPVRLRQGITLHRRQDRFVDSHPAFLHARSLFSPDYRRVSGILVDVLLDHHLARTWQQHSSLPLADFARDFYRHLTTATSLFPEAVQAILTRVIKNDWFGGYATRRGILLALRRLEERSPGLSFTGALADYDRRKGEFATDFTRLLNDLTPFSAANWPLEANVL